MHHSPSEKESKRKEFAPNGSKFFPFRVDPFSEGRKCILYPLKMVCENICLCFESLSEQSFCLFSENSNRYTLTSTPSSMQSHMYPPHHRPPGLAQPPKTIVSMPGYHEPPVLNHLPPSHQPPPSITMPPSISPQTGGSMNPQILSPENLRLVLMLSHSVLQIC